MLSATFRNNVTVTGKGPRTLVFIHGLGCDKHMWRLVAKGLEESNRIVLLDLVGCGGSVYSAWDPHRHNDLSGYALDVVEVLQELGLEQVVLIGHSVGATIAILTARLLPDMVTDLVLVTPSPRFLNEPDVYSGGFEPADIEGLLQLMDRNYIGWAEYLSAAIVQDTEKQDVADEFFEAFCRSDPKASKRFTELTFYADNRNDFATVQHRNLVVLVSNDALVPESVMSYLASHTPHTTIGIINGCGHCPQLTHPEATVELIREFLEAPHSV
jgi:sigma-B regulation protein RsbQ